MGWFFRSGMGPCSLVRVALLSFLLRPASAQDFTLDGYATCEATDESLFSASGSAGDCVPIDGDEGGRAQT